MFSRHRLIMSNVMCVLCPLMNKTTGRCDTMYCTLKRSSSSRPGTVPSESTQIHSSHKVRHLGHKSWCACTLIPWLNRDDQNNCLQILLCNFQLLLLHTRENHHKWPHVHTLLLSMHKSNNKPSVWHNNETVITGTACGLAIIDEPTL